MKPNTNPKVYLTEDNLSEILKVIYPGIEWIRDKTVPDSGLKNRPDFRNDELMLIVEFDGDKHYNSFKTQQRDIIKDRIYSAMGYRIIRIPYFIQMSNETIRFFFGVEIDFRQVYPHGFIDESAVCPFDFNQDGIRLYDNFLESLRANGYSQIADEINRTYLVRKEELQ